MERLTKSQCQVVEEIRVFIEENGYSPTIRELCEILGYKSTSTVHAHLQHLRKAGLITYEATKPRTIAICRMEA